MESPTDKNIIINKYSFILNPFKPELYDESKRPVNNQ